MHRNARLTPAGRLLLCRRIEAGWSVAHAATAMGISRDRAYVWWHRFEKKGWPDWRIARAGPGAAPLGHVHRLSAGSSRCVKTRASARPASPASWAPRPQLCTGSWFDAGSTASTTWTGRQGSQSAGSRCLDPASSSISTSKSWAGSQKVEAGASTVEWLARQVIARRKAAIGYAYVHSAVDGYSRLAYSEVLANEQAATTIGFWLRAQAFFAAHDIGSNECSPIMALVIGLKSSPSHSATSATPLHGPTDQPPMERLNASTGPCWSSGLMHNPGTQRVKETELLDRWLHLYNHHRHHTAIGGPPVSRVSNLV